MEGLRARSIKVILTLIIAILTPVVIARTKDHLVQKHMAAEQQDIFERLTASMAIPPNGDVYSSILKITNGGSTSLSGHRIFCGITRLVTVNGGGAANIGEFVDPKTGKGSVFSPETSLAMDTTPIHAGGDAESSACLSYLAWRSPVRCADVVAGISYSLETQPQIIKTKSFRFVARQYGNSTIFTWSQQPYDYHGTYCANM